MRYVIGIDEVGRGPLAGPIVVAACERLLLETGIDPRLCTVYLDGGLYISKAAGPRKRALVQTEEAFFRGRSILSQTIVKGDEIVPAIRIASICAKVHRDSLMIKLAEKYPGYGFERHKGYGTKAHYAALKKLGISKLHRLTFVP